MIEGAPTEGELAREWREGQGLTRPELAELIGYSVSAIVNFEDGRDDDRPVSEASRQRYRLACAAVHAKLAFDWRTCRSTVQVTHSVTW
jgi:transcriptional regulator with XRE-family HTH domain